MVKLCQWTKMYTFYRFLVRVTTWNKIDKVIFVEILVIVIRIIVCFILYELVARSPLGWHPPHLVDNTDTLYLGGPELTTDIVGFFRFLLFCVHRFANVSVSLCPWACLQCISSLKKLIIRKFPSTAQSKNNKNSD